MIQLSVVIITFNEEKNIGRTIDSVLNLADEVLVVDSFSKDETEKICKSKGVKFIQHKFDGYIEQKNWALQQAKNNKVLSLDADEVLDDDLKSEIKEIKSNWIFDGYYLNRLTNYCGKWIYHGGWYPDKKLRLIDKTKCEWAGINPHDKIIYFNKKSKYGFLNGNLLHYSFNSIGDHLKKIDKYSEIASKAYFESGKKGNYINLYLNPILKFLKSYIVKLGFLDGYFGWKIATLSSYETYLKYKKLICLQK
ncbi:MAG: glycosyltransferase family 2 protein [Bacteroidetes bacterium]|nr:glycosyltransferase family 2 protein [Bacteroidota bacterium]